MKHLVVILLQGLLFANVYFLASAETTLSEDEAGCIEFTNIADDDITVSWKRSCFDDDNSFKIEVFSEDNCTKSYFPCSTPMCEIAIKEMPCFAPPIKPCSNATYIITGNTFGTNQSDGINAAPKINAGDCDLTYNISYLTLDIKWGPLAEEVNDNVRCATKANVYASCTVDGEVFGIEPISAYGLDPTKPGSASLDVLETCLGEKVELLVTYLSLSGDVPTDAVCSTIIDMPASTPGPTTPSQEPSTSTTAPIVITTPVINNNDTDPGKKDLNGGQIAGIVIGTLAGAGLIAGSIAFCYIKKKLCFEEL